MTRIPAQPDLMTPQFLTRAQMRTRPASLLEGIGAAIETEFLVPAGARLLERLSADRDPDFRLTHELLAELGEGLNEDEIDWFYESRSLEEARIMRRQLLALRESRQTLASMGFTGFGLRLGASMFDPAQVAIGAATGGITESIAFSTRLNRLQRMIRGGLVIGSSEAAIESFLASQDPNRSTKDILYAGAGGFLLGGGLNAIRKTDTPDIDQIKAGRIVADIRRQIELDDTTGTPLVQTPKGRQYWYRQLNEKARRQAFDSIISHLDLDDEDLARLRSMTPEEALDTLSGRGNIPQFSAARPEDIQPPPPPPPEPVPSDYTDFNPPNVTKNPPTSSMPNFRGDMSGRVKASPIPLSRAAGHNLAQDALANADDTPTIRTGSEWVRWRHQVEQTKFYRAVHSALPRWMRENGQTWFNGWKKRNEFFEEVTKAQRSGPGYTKNPEINRMADTLRGLYKDLLEKLKKAQVRGFEDVPVNLNYVPRIANLARIYKLIDRYGEESLINFLGDSLLEGSENLTLVKARKLARLWLNHHMRRYWQSGLMKGRLFAPTNTEVLKRVIKEELPDMLDQEIDDIIYKVKPEPGVDTPRAKRRLGFNEGYSARIKDKNGVEDTLSFDDLMENNAEQLFALYSRQAHGAIASRKILDSLVEEGKPALNTWEEFYERLQDQARGLGISPRQVDIDIRRIDALRRNVMGLPINEPGSFGDILRMLRAVSYTTTMNQSGYAQLPDFGNLLGEISWKSWIRQMPAIKQIYSRALDGKLSDKLLDEIELIWAPGTDWLRDPILQRMDPTDAIDDWASTTSTLTERVLHRAKRITTAISGMAPINTFQKRASVLGAVQEWADMAADGRMLSKDQLLSMGLDEEWAGKILKQIKKNFTFEEMPSGRSVKNINIEKWDQETAGRFVTAIDKWSTRVVQETDIGNLSLWMTKDLARLLFQFRYFSATAWVKQFLHGVKVHDLRIFTSWSISMMIAGLSYIAQTYNNSIGRSDQKKYLKKRLAINAIGAAAFQRAGWTSIWPSFIDTALMMTEADPIFRYGRTTGLETNLITGSAPYDLIFNRALPGIRGLLGAALRSDERLTQSEFKQIMGAVPFNNALAVRNMLEIMSSKLPRSN